MYSFPLFDGLQKYAHVEVYLYEMFCHTQPNYIDGVSMHTDFHDAEVPFYP